MTWDEMAIDLLRAAKAMLKTHPRSAASRAYYAAHIALAKILILRGFVPDHGRSTQRHKKQQQMLIEQYLRKDLGSKGVKKIKQAFAHLYDRRIDSDYLPGVTIDSQIAMESVRHASAVFVALGMQEGI